MAAGMGISLLGVWPALGAVMSHGPLVGAVTNSSATVWVRTDTGANNPGVVIKYWPQGSPGQAVYTEAKPTLETFDYTVPFPISLLSTATTYEYAVIVDGVNQSSPPYPKFKTFPDPGAAASFKFALLADLHGRYNADVLATLAIENPAFVVILGDYDHRDPGNESDVLAATRKMHREVRDPNNPSYCAPNCPGDELQANVFHKFPVANVWDDHDYCCNNADGTWDATKKGYSFDAHREYWPSYTLANSNDVGLWHKFSYGSEVEIYMLDLRYQRGPWEWLEPDPCPVPPKSMLAREVVSGTDQKTWPKSRLLDSTASWKFLISSVPWNRTVNKDDSWLNYRCEQDELLNFIHANNISGVVLISGDIHTAGAIDDGTNAGCPEMSVPKTKVPGGVTCFYGCGDWQCDSGASCLDETSRIGYGIVTVDPANQTATLTTKSYTGGSTTYSEVVPEANVCSVPAP
jgi:alkaline phosphatase D